jgi:holo-[acyl-carrier protein] synthase
MIYGIGIDIVQISRIERALHRWGDHFVRRVFTPSETVYCNGKARPATRYALRFAAKEAFAKAMGSGFRQGLSLAQIEVMSTPDGMPYLKLHGTSKALFDARGIKHSFLSLSDDGLYAVAVVVLET